MISCSKGGRHSVADMSSITVPLSDMGWVHQVLDDLWLSGEDWAGPRQLS